MAIKDLEKKLNGEIPVTKEELYKLINSWGRRFNDSGEPRNSYDLSKLDVSQITDMSYLFQGSFFNRDISNWNTSNVTNMKRMFWGAEDFNQSLNWDTLSVTDMGCMFYEATNFNQPLKFNTSNVKDMSEMFYNAERFNQKLNFNTSNVTDMSYMFACESQWHEYRFNQPLNFDTSKVTNMKRMFAYTKAFNQSLNWDTSKVTDMSGMFNGAEKFCQPLNFDTSKVTSMEAMFCNAIAFETKFNNGQVLPNNINYLKRWFNNNIDKMLEIERLNKESTPEHKIAIVENKINNNKTTLDDLFREKNIDPNSKIGLELLKVYNDTHDKLKLELEDLKTQVIDIATNDFNSI